MAKEELKEFKADGEDSSIADPIATGSNDRKADLKKKANPNADSVVDLLGINKGESLLDSGKKMSQTPARLADKRTVKEHVDELFGDLDLSEEFKTKAATIFEAIVIERVEEFHEAIEAEYSEKLDEEIKKITEQVDLYLDDIVESWLEENEVAIETNTNVAMAESFMDGLKSLFEAHNVVLPENGVDVIEELENEIAALEDRLNESEKSNLSLKSALAENTKSAIVSEIAEGLTSTQKDRLQNLAENIDYSSSDEFRSKIATLKESFVSKKTVKGELALNEEFDGVVTDTKIVDPEMSAYLSAVSRTLKK